MMGQKHSHSFGQTLLTIAAVLFCLVIVSSWMVSGIFAKYVRGNSFVQGARVIAFGQLSIAEDTDTYKIIPGVGINKDPKLSFTGSESATYVFLKVTADGWTADTGNSYKYMITVNSSQALSWTVDAGWTYLQTETDGARVYYRVLAPNAVLSDAKVITDGLITVSGTLTRTQLEAMTMPTITFDGAVMQYGGMNGSYTDAQARAAAAWSMVCTH